MQRLFGLTLLLLILIGSNVFAQEYDRCWPLGLMDGYINRGLANLVFRNDSVVLDTVYRDIRSNQTCASVSDSVGNMLFFGNGCVIGGANNDTLLNGDGMNPNSCPGNNCSVNGNVVAEGNLFLPDPGNSQLFHLFHETCNSSTNLSPIALYHSEVDLTLDSGRGAVTNKNAAIYADTLCDGSLTAVKHANGRDWWIIVHSQGDSQFVRFLLSNSLITGPYFQSIGPVYNDVGHGNSKFSPDGNWYASSTLLGGIDLYHFNRCNGLLSDYQYLDFPDSMWYNTIEFSADSKVLYTFYMWDIYQFDLTATNVFGSKQLVAVHDNFQDTLGNYTVFWFPQLAPNGKIYVSTPGAMYLHVVDQPDSIGPACNVLQHSIALPCLNRIVPNFPNYRLGALDSIYCDTVDVILSEDYDSGLLTVYPNPASEQVYIKANTPGEEIRECILFDSTGRIALTHANTSELQVALLANGFYYLEVQTNQRRYFRKLLIEN